MVNNSYCTVLTKLHCIFIFQEELLSRQRLDIRAVASGTAEGRVEAYHLQQTCLGETVLVRSLPLYPRVFSVDEMRGAVDQLMHQSCAIFAQ